MAYDENRQTGGFANKAVQEKLEYWWGTLRPTERKKMLAVARAKGGAQRTWLELPEDVREAVFHAGMFMKRVTKNFPN